MKISKEERIYNQAIGDMGIYLVMHKILPNELALYNYDIVINIETVDLNNEVEVSKANRLLLKIYDKLKNHWKFKDKIRLEEDKIVLLEG